MLQDVFGTEMGAGPFFSADGQSIGFVRKLGTVAKISLAGGVPVPLFAGLRGMGRGAAWAPDGTIYFSPNASAGLWKMSSAGGAPQRLTEPVSA